MKQNKLTVNREPALVIQNPESDQELRDRLEAVEAIRVGIQAAEQGGVRPAREALEELGAKLDIPS